VSTPEVSSTPVASVAPPQPTEAPSAIAASADIDARKQAARVAVASRTGLGAEDAYSARREARELEEARVVEFEAELAEREAAQAALEDRRAQLAADDLRQLSDDAFFSVRVILQVPASGVPGSEVAVPPTATDVVERVFRYHLPVARATVQELKLVLADELAVPYGTLYVYAQCQSTDDADLLASLPGVRNNSVLRAYYERDMDTVIRTPLRPVVSEAVIDDARTLVALADGTDCQPELCTPPLPRFRDWAQQQMDLAAAMRAAGLQRIDGEKAMHKLADEFKAAACTVARAVVADRLRAVDLLGSYGVGGDTFVCGGVVLRRAAHWIIEGVDLGDGEAAARYAASYVATMDALRAAEIPDLVVPLCAMVDWLGHRFVALPLINLTPDLLVAGSTTDGLTIACTPEGAEMAAKIARAMNVAPHRVRSRLAAEIALAGGELATPELRSSNRRSAETGEFAPVSPQDPTGVDVDLDLRTTIWSALDGSCFFVTNVGSLMPPDVSASVADVEGVAERAEDVAFNRICHRLRPEIAVTYSHADRLPEGFQMFTSLHPHACDHCGRIILDYEFFEFDPDAVISEALEREYDLCLQCHATAPDEALDVPRRLLKRAIVPQAERVTYWKGPDGEVSLVRPVVRTSLNPDAPRYPRPVAEVVAAARPEFECDLESDVDLLRAVARRLHHTVIPDLISDLDADRATPEASEDLVDELRVRGVSERYLGLIAGGASAAHVRELAVRAVLVRVLATLLRDGLSFASEEAPMEDAASVARGVVLRYLNEAFGADQESPDAQRLWEAVGDLSATKYHYRVVPTDRARVYLPAVARDVCRFVGVDLDPEVEPDYSMLRPFLPEFILGAHPVVQMGQIPPEAGCELASLLARATELDRKGTRLVWHHAGGPERAEATEILREALAVAEHIYGADSEEVANVLTLLADHLKSRFDEAGRPEFSRWNRSAGIPPSELSTEAKALYERALALREKEAAGFPSTERAHILRALAGLSQSSGEEDSQERTIALLQEAAGTLEGAVGFQHPATAALYEEVALLYQEFGQFDDAATFIRRAFVVFFVVFGPDSTVTRRCHARLQPIETSIASGLESVPLSALVDAIEQLELPGESEEAEMAGLIGA
jgi:tetratricopeptide (TPR) repeat protein